MHSANASGFSRSSRHQSFSPASRMGCLDRQRCSVSENNAAEYSVIHSRCPAVRDAMRSTTARSLLCRRPQNAIPIRSSTHRISFIPSPPLAVIVSNCFAPRKNKEGVCPRKGTPTIANGIVLLLGRNVLDLCPLGIVLLAVHRLIGANAYIVLLLCRQVLDRCRGSLIARNPRI